MASLPIATPAEPEVSDRVDSASGALQPKGERIESNEDTASTRQPAENRSQQPSEASATVTAVTPSADALQVHLPEWLQLANWQLFGVFGFCMFFLYQNYLPLFYSDVWGHVAYGEWILEHGHLPAVEPFVQLADGVDVFVTAWLGQVSLAAAGLVGGPEGYSALFSVTNVLTYVVLATALYRRCGASAVAMFGALLAWFVNWGRHAVIRPEMFGCCCFAVLLLLLTKRHRAFAGDDRRPASSKRDDEAPEVPPAKWLAWIGVPLVMALWANLHGSFVVGLVTLGCFPVARAADLLWRGQGILGVVRDRGFHQGLLLTELATAAVMLNPHGFDLLIHTAIFPNNPNLKDIVEWYSLEMVSLEGIAMGAAWVILVAVLRISRVRLHAIDVCLLAVFSLAVCLRVRMVAWFAPVWIWALVPHIRDVCLQAREKFGWHGQSAGSRFLATRHPRNVLFALLMIWLAYAFSPSSSFLLGQARATDQVYHRKTPRELTAWLRENPPSGLVANPQWWGDWLVYDGPENLQVMMTTNAVHVAPQRVWKDYMAVAQGSEMLDRILHKYRVNTVILDKELQGTLDRRLRARSGWQVAFENELSKVYVRQIATESDTDSTSPH